MNRAVLIAGCALGLMLQCGCIHLKQSTQHRTPQELPAALRDSFHRPDASTVTAREMEVESHGNYDRIRFELQAPTLPRGTNPVVFDYYQLPAPRSPVILILPISGGRKYPAEEIFAHHFARNGFAAIVAHRWKMPRDFDLDAIDRSLRVSLEENQMVLDWIETRPELDGDRIGLFGISLGGIRGVMLTALDPRIKASALGLAGGDLAAILSESKDRGVERRRGEFLARTNWTPSELRMKLRKSITCEPNEFAPCIDPHRVLLVLALFDRVVPFKHGWQLRERLGKPETLLLPTGHFTAILAIPAIQLESVEFFETRMGIGLPASERKKVHSPRGESLWR